MHSQALKTSPCSRSQVRLGGGNSSRWNIWLSDSLVATLAVKTKQTPRITSPTTKMTSSMMTKTLTRRKLMPRTVLRAAANLHQKEDRQTRCSLTSQLKSQSYSKRHSSQSGLHLVQFSITKMVNWHFSWHTCKLKYGMDCPKS